MKLRNLLPLLRHASVVLLAWLLAVLIFLFLVAVVWFSGTNWIGADQPDTATP